MKYKGLVVLLSSSMLVAYTSRAEYQKPSYDESGSYDIFDAKNRKIGDGSWRSRAAYSDRGDYHEYEERMSIHSVGENSSENKHQIHMHEEEKKKVKKYDKKMSSKKDKNRKGRNNNFRK